MNGHFRSFNPFNPRPEYHEERNLHVDRLIRHAGMCLQEGHTEEQVVAELVKSGAQTHEAVNALRAAQILA